MPSIQLDHIGIAVHDAEAVAKLFKEILQIIPYKSEEVEDQGVRTHFLAAGTAKLELLEATSDASPIAKYLAKNKEGIHHIAFEVANIKATWRKLEKLGYQLIGTGPSPGADGKTIFFMHPKQTHGMLIEFCQSERKQLQPTKIPFKDGELAVYELGDDDKPALVLLHGAGGCLQMELEPMAHRLSKHYKIYALDFAAHGQSDAFMDEPFEPALFIDNVAAVFDHFNLTQVNLFGFSLGGFIALSYAYHNPERVRRLAVHATHIFWDPALVETMLTRVDHENIQNTSPELVRYLGQMHGKENWISLFERTKDYTVNIINFKEEYQHVKDVKTPTLVSSVDEDDLFEVDSPVRLHNTLANSNLAIIPGKRHAFQNVNLDLMVPLLRRHFDQR